MLTNESAAPGHVTPALTLIGGQVAGTFVRVPWSGRSTEQDLCRNSRCLGFPFPTGKVSCDWWRLVT